MQLPFKSAKCPCIWRKRWRSSDMNLLFSFDAYSSLLTWICGELYQNSVTKRNILLHKSLKEKENEPLEIQNGCMMADQYRHTFSICWTTALNF